MIDEIILYDILGKQLLRTVPTAVSFSMDMTDLTSGMYLLEARIGGDTKSFKVMK